MRNPRRKTCFVIMPYGEKSDPDGNRINFDITYEFIIKKAIVDMKDRYGVEIDCIRADKIEESGSIHADMFEQIAIDDIAIVDITTLNPNVFYELGIRHALRKGVTVLMKKVGSSIPFNIQGMRTIDYDYSDVDSYARTREQIQRFIANGIMKDQPDSPVLAALPNVRVDFKEEALPRSERFEYRLINGKLIGVITGDILHVKGVDVWVNAENTNMQMARFHDWAVSSVIRYAGAKKNEIGEVEEDTIAAELTGKLDGSTSVAAGTVIVTSSGALLETNGVKAIYHAAAVEGIMGGGYVPVRNITMCVTNALKRASTEKYETLVTPLMGVGMGGELRQTVEKLMTSAIAFLEQNPSSSVSCIYFMAWSPRELATCLGFLDNSPEAKFVPPGNPPNNEA
jgi:O-acetyl-ADP-ribose deacetylase (regulator of RNase III)